MHQIFVFVRNTGDFSGDKKKLSYHLRGKVKLVNRIITFRLGTLQ